MDLEMILVELHNVDNVDNFLWHLLYVFLFLVAGMHHLFDGWTVWYTDWGLKGPWTCLTYIFLCQ